MKILNDLKVVCTRHSDSEHLWLKHHDPLDIGWFENTSHKDARWKIWQPGMHSYDAAPGRVGEQFNNYFELPDQNKKLRTFVEYLLAALLFATALFILLET